MTTPFEYPTAPHVRRHGPAGYTVLASYQPWLRDEFSFRCVYCLVREQWGRLHGIYDLDHFLPAVSNVERTLDYDNLLYACATCNSVKGSRAIPDPLLVLTSPNVKVGEDGVLRAETPESARVIKLLGLNDRPAVEFRLLWIGIVALAAKGDADIYRKLMGFPSDLPDLAVLRPPENTRPLGLQESWYSRRQQGTLPESY